MVQNTILKVFSFFRTTSCQRFDVRKKRKWSCWRSSWKAGRNDSSLRCSTRDAKKYKRNINIAFIFLITLFLRYIWNFKWLFWIIPETKSNEQYLEPHSSSEKHSIWHLMLVFLLFNLWFFKSISSLWRSVREPEEQSAAATKRQC